MEIPRRINSTIYPNCIFDLGNGNWYYNYDIQSEEVETQYLGEDSIIKETRYNYIQIKLPEKPNYKLCVEAIIRQYISQSQEFDLINSANKALMNGDTSSEDIIKYQQYLNLVDEIKAKVANDLKN